MSDPLGIAGDGLNVQNNGIDPMLLKKRPSEEIIMGPPIKKMILT